MSPRPDISMGPDEVRAFLATRPRAVLAALDDGAPVGTVVDVVVVDDGIAVTIADPIVAALVTRDDRVCVVADQFPVYHEIRGVVAHGRARHLTPVVDGPGAGGVTFRLDLDDVVTFDFAKLPREGAGSGRAR